MPSTPSPIVVLVPVKLDAFVFNHAVCNGEFDKAKIAPITQPNYTFLRVDEFVAQHDVLPHVDLHLSSPSTTNLRLMDLGTGLIRRRTGVYLHWSLPRAYRRGITPEKDAAQDASKFPAVPTRWLVIRRLHSQKNSQELPVSSIPVSPIPEFQAWVVESDKLNDIDNLDAKVDLEVDVSPFIETKPNNIEIGRQAEVFIGGKTAANEWKEGDEAGIRQELTVLTSSNPLFADYQPHNSNVFSMLDRFEHDDGTQLTEATASYYVLGWHSSVTSDILHQTASPLLPLSDRLGKLLMTLVEETSKDEVTPAQVLCHGAMYDVMWNADKKPAIVAADKSSKRLNSAMPVAVGTTVLDALLAFVKIHMHDEKEKGTADKYSVSSLEADIWRIHGLLLARDDGVDGQREAADLLNHHNYDRVQCGTLFHLHTPDTAGDGKTSPRPSDETIAQLAELNRVQYALDLTTRTVRKLRWDLFALWWKYVSSKKIGLANSNEKTQVSALSTRLTTLLSHIKSLADDVAVRNDSLKAKEAAMPSAYQQRDPTLLVTGIKSGWPHDFMDPLKVRLRKHIMTADANDLPKCRDALQAIIKRTLPTDLRGDGSALADEFLLLSPPDNKQPTKPKEVPPLYHDLDLDPDQGEESFRDRWQNTQPWFPLFLEWEVEYTHTPMESWILQERLSTNDPMATRKLRYGIAPGGWPVNEPDSRHFSGRSLILPQPNFSLKSRIEQVFKNNATTVTPEESLTEEQRNMLINNVSKLPFMSALLTGLTDHLVTRAHGSHIKPNVRVPSQELQVIDDIVDKNAADAGFTAKNLKLIGRESDLTPYGNLVRPENKYALFKPVTHGRLQFTKINVIDKFGQAIHALNPMHPTGDCPADKLYPCVGEFYSSPIADESMPSEYVYLPPQINQFARLNSCFVVADESPGSSGWRPTTEWDTSKTNPIWGWVLVNAPDNGIQLFLPTGEFYRAVRVGGSAGTSTSAKWLPKTPPLGLTPTSTNQLQCLAQELGNPEYLKAFIAMIYEATRNGTSAPTAYSQFVSSLVGKPFALANMGWSLELAVDAYTNQATLDSNTPEPGLKTDYEFQIKFGDQDQVYDGLAGYFNVDVAKHKLDFTKFYTYQRNSTDSPPADNSPLQIIGPTNYPKFCAHWVSPENPDGNTLKSPADIDKERNAELRVFGAILDPFTAVHAYSSFLPTTALQLPPFTWQSAMSKLSAFFHLGPLLVTTDVTAPPSSEQAKEVQIPADVAVPPPSDEVKTGKVPIPAMGLAEWCWQQPCGGADADGNPTTTMKLGIETLDQRPRFEEAPYTAIEGYLELITPLMARDIEKQKEQ